MLLEKISSRRPFEIASAVGFRLLFAAVRG
jgi:hypothetical protein